jgi:hypothetical protein
VSLRRVTVTDTVAPATAVATPEQDSDSDARGAMKQVMRNGSYAVDRSRDPAVADTRLRVIRTLLGRSHWLLCVRCVC